MKILLSWLREQLDGAPTADRLAERLTAAGLNVETREKTGEAGDEVWDVDVTTNRPDAMNHRGLAREAAAAGCGTLKPLGSALHEAGAPAPTSARVTVEDPAGCPRYCARVIRGVRVGPSPEWIAARLERCGIRPINNVVDATNVMLLELGQPLHAFDLDRLAGRQVIVRAARPGELLTTLDGVERRLDAADLVIADRDRPIGLAGVMGGADSEIGEATRDVLLESANFDSIRVRRTARRHGLSTEASFRFERGGDRAMARTAVDLAAALIVRLAGGEVAPGVMDSDPDLPPRREIRFSPRRLSAFAGCDIPTEFVLEVLTALDLAPALEGELVRCTVPPFRVDLELPEDVYEEVLRHWGYDRIPAVLPPATGGPGARLGAWPLVERARLALASVGLAENVSYAFLAAELEQASASSPLAARGDAVPLSNPLSARMALMRRSLLGGLAEAAAGNLRRGNERVALGEIGRVFFADGGAVREEERAALVLGGMAGAWDGVRPLDFLDLKGALEAVLDQLGVGAARWRPAAAAMIAPGQGAEIVIGGAVIAVAGRASDELVSLVDAPAPLWLAEIDLAAAASRPTPVFAALQRFPAVTADLTVRHALELPFERLAATVRDAAPAWLESVSPVIRYRGEGVGAGEVKTTLRLVYRHAERSLTQDEVNEAHFALMHALERQLGVSFT